MVCSCRGAPSRTPSPRRCEDSIEPDKAAFNLGVLLSKEHPDEALTWCRKAAELRPQDARYAYTLTFYQNQQGQTKEAVQTLERALKQSPPHPEAYALLGEIYEGQKKVADAASVTRTPTGRASGPRPGPIGTRVMPARGLICDHLIALGTDAKR